MTEIRIDSTIRILISTSIEEIAIVATKGRNAIAERNDIPTASRPSKEAFDGMADNWVCVIRLFNNSCFPLMTNVIIGIDMNDVKQKVIFL